MRTLLSAAAPAAAEPMLAKGGQAQAAIVVGPDASPLARWVASELQAHLKRLSGAELPVVPDADLPVATPLVVLGGPKANPLAAIAEEKGFVRFADLKPDGFVLKRIYREGRPVLVVGGNDESGTMYAVYELLERLGIVFQLTNDIIPQQRPDLPLPALDVRMEPVFKYRGMHCWHQIRWYMGLADFRREIDQLAKLKMNVLQFYMGMGAPYVAFSYKGKPAEVFGVKASGFVAWPGASGTANSVVVGRECFRQDGCMGPPEFAKVQTPQDAQRAAREFLREVIPYAHSRNVKVWLAMGEMPWVPPNLVPAGVKSWFPFYCGIAIPHGEPAMLDIWVAAVQSMIETYPEADRFWVATGEESAMVATDDPQTQALVKEHQALRALLPENAPAWTDNNLVDVVLADKLVRRIKARHPTAKLGVELVFRGGQLRALDAVLPKDVALMNMVNWPGETAMSDFDKIQGRDLVAWPRITDDGCELNIQLNARMYDHDQTIPGAARYRLAGVLGQLNKARGAEQSAQYIAEGAWNADIHCESFYRRYLGRLYGPDALDPLLKAFLLLEENEKALGWRGRRGLFSTWSAGCARLHASLRSVNFKEAKIRVNRAELEKAIQAAEAERAFWEGRAAHCGRALELLRQSRPKVYDGSRAELDYVIYKTENFITVFQKLAAADQARAAFDRALLAWDDGKMDEAGKHLEQCRVALDRAGRLVRQAAEQMIPYARIDPTERHILWIFNKAIPSHDAAQRYLADVIAVHKAKIEGAEL